MSSTLSLRAFGTLLAALHSAPEIAEANFSISGPRRTGWLTEQLDSTEENFSKFGSLPGPHGNIDRFY
jgi:hypothetical protein